MPPIIAYHDRSATYHQRRFNELRPQGYRLISLCVYNHLPALNLKSLYAAVWVKRSGPTWSAIHNAGAAQYQAFFDKWAAEGFHPVLLSVSGTGNALKFAGTMEKRPGPIPLTRFGLRSGSVDDDDTIEFWDKQAREKGWLLSQGAVYGIGGERRYAGIWTPNTTGIAWSAAGIDDTAAEYQARFNAQTSAWGRLAFVALSEDHRYLSVFRDDHIGEGKARHNLTSDEYQTEFDTLTNQDFYPVVVQAGGFGPGRRFAAIFVRQEQVIERRLSVTGGPLVLPIDLAVIKVMQDSNCRGAALALVKGTKLILARGYTLAEPGYPIVQPTTLFRLASVSKVLPAIAIYQLIEQGQLTLDTKVQSILQLSPPGGGPPLDPRLADITVRHLLEFTAGLESNSMWLYNEILAAHNDAVPGDPFQLPVTPAMADAFIAARMLRGDPGAPATLEYSNACYWLAGRVVAKLRGVPTFAAAIQSSISQPLGITRLRHSHDLAGGQPPDEARYHSPALVIEANGVTPGGPIIPAQYGGNNLSLVDASGGMSAAVTDLARIIAAMNAPQGTPMLSRASVLQMLANGAAQTDAGMSRAGHGFDKVELVDAAKQHYTALKGGAIHASQSGFWYDRAGISMVIVWNTSGIAGNWFPNFPAVLDAAENVDWSAQDLFPEYGMPSLVQLGQIDDGVQPVEPPG